MNEGAIKSRILMISNYKRALGVIKNNLLGNPSIHFMSSLAKGCGGFESKFWKGVNMAGQIFSF